MNKKIILPALIILAFIAGTIFLRDGWVYLIISLMALAILGAIRYNKSTVMKMTRWAKANPKKSQLIISFLQIVLMSLGILAGYNFKELGYELPWTMAFVFGAIIVLGFLSVPFLPKPSTIALPQVVNRNRLAFAGIALSSFVLMVLFGNKMGTLYPNSPLTHAVKKIDHAIFANNSAAFSDYRDAGLETALPDIGSSSMIIFASYSGYANASLTTPTDVKKEFSSKPKPGKKLRTLEKRKARIMSYMKKHRLAFAAGISAGAVLLIILLVITTCAGVCLVIGGISSGSAGLIPLGVVIAGASIYGMIKIGKGSNRKTRVRP